MNMEKGKSSWIKLNPEKLMSVGNESGSEIKSYLVPSKVPVAARVSVNDGFIKFEYKYEPDLSEQEEQRQYNTELFTIDINTWIGTKSKRLYALEMPIEKLSEFRIAAYEAVRAQLDNVRHEHPRWGSFSAVSNVFKQYASKLESNFHLQEFA